jgi:TRAP-type C4-dicarboxylate transport system permease small subunit
MAHYLQIIRRMLNNTLLVLSAAMLIIMTGLVLWQVFTRYVLNAPSIYTEELVTIILIWTGYFCASYVYGTRQDMALVFLKERLSGKKLRALCLIIDVAILIFAVGIMILGGYKAAMNTMKVLTPVLQIPKGMVYMIAPITGALILIHQFINIWEDIFLEDESRLKQYESLDNN